MRSWLLIILFAATPAAVAADPVRARLVSAGEVVGSSVSTLSKNDKHFEALTKFYSQEDFRFTIEDLLSASHSAWALGLTDQARALWQRVLSDNTTAVPDRVRELLSWAIMELQEDQFEKARELAEQAAYDLESSDLRSQLWLVIAESFREQGTLKRAESYYKKASLEGNLASRAEATFLLGECQRNLGLLKDARYTFTSIPMDSRYVPQALRRLMEIDFTERDYEGALTWISEGEERATAEFEDPQVHYTKVMSLLELRRADQAEQALKKFELRYSANNSWYVLAQASVLRLELDRHSGEKQE